MLDGSSLGGDLSQAAIESLVTPSSMADFSLVDVNHNSASHNQAVSPRDYLDQVSAWYFGHAT
jgi:hypothetical protein